MSDPVSHHWLPQFLMRPWCGKDKKVTRFYRPHDRVISGRKSPGSIGAEDHLYTVVCKYLEDPAHYEKRVMTGAADTPAAVMRDRLLAGDIPAKSENLARSEFGRFLIFLKLRQPDVVKQHRERIGKPIDETVEKLRQKLPPDYFEAHFSHHVANLQGVGDLHAMHSLLELTTHHALVPQIADATWRVVDVAGAEVEFVLGDDPAMIAAADDRLWEIRMPISPTKLLVIGDRYRMDQDLRLQEPHKRCLVLDINRAQFEKAKDFVIATGLGPNDGLLTLAERYMRRRCWRA